MYYVQDTASNVLHGLCYFTKCYSCFVNEKVKA